MEAPSECLDTLYSGDDVLFCTDSVFRVPSPDSLPKHESPFRSHSLAVTHKGPQIIAKSGDGGYVFAVSVFLFVAFLVFAILRKLDVKSVLLAAFSMRQSNILVRDSGIRNDFSLLPLVLVYYSSLATACYVALSKIFGISFYGPLDLPILIAAVMLFSFVRHVLTKLLGIICGERDTVNLYILSGNFFQIIGIVFLIPISVVACYVDPSFVWAAVTVAALVFLFRLARGLSIVLSKSGGIKLYLFYYLCIIEIVPVLILVKVLIAL